MCSSKKFFMLASARHIGEDKGEEGEEEEGRGEKGRGGERGKEKGKGREGEAGELAPPNTKPNPAYAFFDLQPLFVAVFRVTGL
jgi:hypothetical protein